MIKKNDFWIEDKGMCNVFGDSRKQSNTDHENPDAPWISTWINYFIFYLPLGAFMVTTLRMSQLQTLEENGFFKEVNWQPQLLLEALQRAHFTDVNMKNFQQGSTKYEAIFAAIN